MVDDTFVKWTCTIDQCEYTIKGTVKELTTGAVSHYKKYHADEHYKIE